MEFSIDEGLRLLIPTLAEAERSQLEENLKREGCRDPLVIWNGKDVLLDGHHRFEICHRNQIPYKTERISLPDRNAAKAWIIRNQFGRRNLAPFVRAELALKLEPLIAAKARANMQAGGGSGSSGRQNSAHPTKTRDEVAKAAGLSHDTIHKAKLVTERSSEEVKARLRTGEETINHAYTAIQREEKQKKQAEIRATVAENAVGQYGVVVIDPPWPVEKIERNERPNQAAWDYPPMSVEEIREFDLDPLLLDDAHVFLWTTQKFLPAAFDVLESWGLRYVCTMVWHKAGGFQPFGLPQYNCEFCLYARKGAPKFAETKAFMCCFDGDRREHSRKPEEFYEMVRRVTEGRRIDVFSRERRDGYAQWGNEPQKFELEP